jgi:hypothetical protein
MACGVRLRNLNGRLKPGHNQNMQAKEKAGTDLYSPDCKNKVAMKSPAPELPRMTRNG